MGGQLMRTPILEKIIQDISNKKLSKTIALDECHSLGTLLYTLFIVQKKKFEKLNKVSSITKNYFKYQINSAHIIISNFKKEKIKIKLGNYNNLSNMVYINFFYKKGNDFILSLYEYNIKKKKKKYNINRKKNRKDSIYIIIKVIRLELEKKNSDLSKFHKSLKLLKKFNFKDEPYNTNLKNNQEKLNKITNQEI